MFWAPLCLPTPQEVLFCECLLALVECSPHCQPVSHERSQESFFLWLCSSWDLVHVSATTSKFVTLNLIDYVRIDELQEMHL